MRPPGLLVASYGGGVDSVAELIYLRRAGSPPPRAILMANPGSEKSATMRYLGDWMNPRLRKWGWPEVEVIDRAHEGALRPLHQGRVRRPETLREECLRTKTLPSIAYGKKKCSQKFKGDPQRWWAARQPWAQAEWRAGRKLVKVIGYDFDEPARVQRSLVVMSPPPPGKRDYFKWERERFDFWFPLFEARLRRADCEALIRSERMPVPPKSSCTFCPNNTLEEWEALRRDEPEAFAQAVEMSRNAAENIDSPEVVGLMRCNIQGRRQLHEWADGKYALGPLFEQDPIPACGCAT